MSFPQDVDVNADETGLMRGTAKLPHPLVAETRN
jgi:hypothetical protein